MEVAFVRKLAGTPMNASICERCRLVEASLAIRVFVAWAAGKCVLAAGSTAVARRW